MINLNKVLLAGNLTRNPELRHTSNNFAVTDLRLAVNRKYKASNGENQEEVCYVSIVVWGKQAENCEKYLSKGSSVFVEGRLQYDEWEDKEKGQKVNRLRVVAERVQFLGSSDKSSGSSGRTVIEDDVPSDSDSGGKSARRESDADSGKDNSGDDEDLPF